MTSADPPPQDVLDSGSAGRRRTMPWSRWTSAQRRAAALVLVLPTAVVVLVLLGASVRAWWEERQLRDVIAVDVELDVVAASSAWSPGGSGRVEYFLVLHNRGPRSSTVTGVRIERPGLTGSGSPVRRAPVAPGGVGYVPLSVRLDCARWRPATSARAVHARVAVVAASGRSTQVSTPVRRAGLLTGVVDALCRRYPDLRIAELSGPVRAVVVPGQPLRPPVSRPRTK